MLYLVPQIIPHLVSLIRNIRTLGIQVVREVSTTFGDPPLLSFITAICQLYCNAPCHKCIYIHTYVSCKFTALEVRLFELLSFLQVFVTFPDWDCTDPQLVFQCAVLPQVAYTMHMTMTRRMAVDPIFVVIVIVVQCSLSTHVQLSRLPHEAVQSPTPLLQLLHTWTCHTQ